MKRHLKRAAAAFAAFAATLLAAHSAALVSTSPDLAIGGENTPSESPPPSSAALGHVKVPTTFDTNVYLHDAPTVPLHLRLAGAASGDITPHSITLQGERIEEWNDIVEWLQGDLPFIPKWPTWYKLGSSDTNDAPDAASSSGLFSTFLGGMFLQSRNASLRLRARGDGLSVPASVEIASEKGGVDISAGNTANLSAKSFTVTSTVATSGITLTNSAAGDFTVTWNGLTLTNWTDLAQWFIPKWPTWYKLGSSDTNDTPDAASSSGLFSTFLGGMFLQSRNASLRLRARGDGLSVPASVEIASEKGGVDISAGNTANLSAKSFTVTSTVATSGITLTNSAAGDFTVTWNGLTLTNWTDLAQWFIPKWPSLYKFGNAGDEVDASTAATESGLFRYLAGVYLQNVGGPVIINAATGPTTPFRPPNVKISAAGDIMLSSTNISLGNGRVSAGNISANSIAIGTNDVGEAVASVERRVGVIETNTAAWTAEIWTFILTNGASVSKSVLVEGAP